MALTWRVLHHINLSMINYYKFLLSIEMLWPLLAREFLPLFCFDFCGTKDILYLDDILLKEAPLSDFMPNLDLYILWL